jgi:hypothetical protein
MVISAVGAEVGDVVGFSTICGIEVAVGCVEQAESNSVKTTTMTRKLR